MSLPQPSCHSDAASNKSPSGCPTSPGQPVLANQAGHSIGLDSQTLPKIQSKNVNPGLYRVLDMTSEIYLYITSVIPDIMSPVSVAAGHLVHTRQDFCSPIM